MLATHFDSYTESSSYFETRRLLYCDIRFHIVLRIGSEFIFLGCRLRNLIFIDQLWHDRRCIGRASLGGFDT